LFGAWFLKEKVRIVDVFTTILALFGMVMFFNGKLEFGGITGNLVAVLSGISYAWFTLFMRKQKDGDTLPAIFLGNIITALIGVPFMIQSFPAVKFVPVIALMALFQYTIPYILYSKAIKDVNPSFVSKGVQPLI
jgi:drug/metabolite transporter (DMT)-like permease